MKFLCETFSPLEIIFDPQLDISKFIYLSCIIRIFKFAGALSKLRSDNLPSSFVS